MVDVLNFRDRMGSRHAMGWRVFAFACLTIVVSGCGPQVRELPDGRVLPVTWDEWALVPNDEPPEKLLRFDVLYVIDLSPGVPYDSAKGYPGRQRLYWYRFWPNGRFHCWGATVDQLEHGRLTPADGERFKWLGAGRYAIVGGEIRLGSVGMKDTLFFPPWMWNRKIATVQWDGSLAVNEADCALRCRPVFVGELRGEPDW